MKTQDDYLGMQRKWYDESSLNVETIVGQYDFQENFPYETLLLYRNGDVRKPVVQNPATKRAFDIGCGEGRMIRRMSQIFERVDGGDISQKMVSAARERCPDSTVYLTAGANCGDAKTSSYDFAYCTISLQHISSHAIRKSIFKDVTRILMPDGCATFQLLFSESYPFNSSGLRSVVKNRHQDMLVEVYIRNFWCASWFEDKFDATGTNSVCDGIFGVNDIPAVVEDFKTLFDEVDMWFWDISIGRAGADEPRILPMEHPNSHLYNTYHGTHFAFIHCRAPKK